MFGKPEALDLNGKIEFERNQERYSFLRWGQKAFDNFKVVPPRTAPVAWAAPSTVTVLVTPRTEALPPLTSPPGS